MDIKSHGVSIDSVNDFNKITAHKEVVYFMIYGYLDETTRKSLSLKNKEFPNRYVCKLSVCDNFTEYIKNIQEKYKDLHDIRIVKFQQVLPQHRTFVESKIQDKLADLNKFCCKSNQYLRLCEDLVNDVSYFMENLTTTLEKKIQCLRLPCNKGEIGELHVKKTLFEMSQNLSASRESLVKIFGKKAKKGIQLLSPSYEIIKDLSQLKKSPSAHKCDIIVKMMKTKEIFNISIKCFNGRNPAIVNHTPRSANYFQKLQDLYVVDGIVKKIHTESTCSDVSISKLKLDSRENKKIQDILAYFIFKGTGHKKSSLEADSLLEIQDPLEMSEWKFMICKNQEEKIDYVKTLLPRIVFQMRSKGTPDKEKDAYKKCKEWICYSKGNPDKPLGSIHIRVKK